MNILGTEYTGYDLTCAALVICIVGIAMCLITIFFFYTLVVFGGPTY